MKKFFKQSLAVILAIVMVFGVAPLTEFMELELPVLNLFDTKAEAAVFEIGSLIEFGTYPQSEVTDSLTLSELNKIPLEWKSYEYYSGNDGKSDGLMQPQDYMSYCDVEYNGIKYRAVFFDKFRPFSTTIKASTSAEISHQSKNGYECNNIYWFKWEPIIWEVLDPSKGIVICKSIIDSQAFNNTIYEYTKWYNGGHLGVVGYYKDSSCSSFADNFWKSSLREWLNDDFYNVAFTNSQQKNIKTIKFTTQSSGDIISTNEYNVNVILFNSEGEINNTHIYDACQVIASGTDYAKCQGLSVSNNENSLGYSAWWSREDTVDTGEVHIFKENGSLGEAWVDRTDVGIRPYLWINLNAAKMVTQFISSPANGEKYFSLNDDIVITFNKVIQGVSVDTICIRDYETDKVVCTAGINCIEKNGNMLTLKHMVHSPIVDENGKTVEGGKLKGNMKYYLDIPSYAIRFSDGYFEGTKTKDDLAFSTYISKDRSLEDYGFKQEYTEGSKTQETISNNHAEFKYFYNNNDISGKALDDFCVPGLKEGMVPQGLTYYPEKQWYLISAYHKSDLPAEEKNNSVIYALDEDGEFVAQFNIHTAYGKDSRIHAGGIAVGEHNLYLTYYDSQIAYIPLSELNVPEGTLKDVCIRSSVDLCELMNNTGTAYLNYSEGVLWTGNFYCTTLEAKFAGAAATEDETGWNTPASEKANSIMLGYDLEGTDSLSEWNSFTKIVKSNGASHTIYLPNKYDGIQGATIHNGVIYLSRAEWRPSSYDNNTAILAHESYFLGQSELNLPDKNWVVINNLPGGENIFFKGDKLYCVYEASALGELNFVLWNTKVETDVIWEIDIKKLLKNTRLGTVNCPVDIEIYDEDTGELVGRIKDNIVDSTIADKDNSIPMEVDGETKYYWLSANKNYQVVLIGNDKGTMDYSLSSFDENAQLKERAIFFDVELTEGLTYINQSVGGDSLSQSVLEAKDGTEIEPDQYFDNIQKANAEISVSSGEGGTVTESFKAVFGDKVTVEANAKDGYLFYAWTENGKIVSTDAEYSFVVKNHRTLKAEFIAFSLRAPSTTTISYGDSIIFHADLSEALPSGWNIEWTASNENFSYSVSDDGLTCTISPSSKGDTTFTATVYDANGNPVSSDEQTMTSKAGFFDKIIAFFKKLFGLTKTIPQIYKGIF